MRLLRHSSCWLARSLGRGCVAFGRGLGLGEPVVHCVGWYTRIVDQDIYVQCVLISEHNGYSWVSPIENLL